MLGFLQEQLLSQWQEKIDKLKKPVGVNYIWGGDQENQSEGFGTLGIALLAAIILVYLSNGWSYTIVLFTRL